MSNLLAMKVAAQFDRVDALYTGWRVEEHLLRYTNCLADYITDETFLAKVMRNPQRHWLPKAILQHFDALGLAQKAATRPGETMHYSDTNYLLLGLIVEQVTGRPLHQNLTEHMFESLEMGDTYLEFY